MRDKRLLVFEPEFANVLRVLERQGNRLSSVVRDAWDGRTLGERVTGRSLTSSESTAGRENGCTRPKGYAAWHPHGRTKHLLERDGHEDPYAEAGSFVSRGFLVNAAMAVGLESALGPDEWRGICCKNEIARVEDRLGGAITPSG